MIKHEDFIIQYPFKEKKWSVENTKFFFLRFLQRYLNSFKKVNCVCLIGKWGLFHFSDL